MLTSAGFVTNSWCKPFRMAHRVKFRSDLSVEPGIHWLVDSLPVEMLLPKPQATA